MQAAEKFLYELGRCWLGVENSARLTAALERTTWKEVAGLAAAHGLSGYLYYACRNGWLPAVPPAEQVAAWKGAYHQQALQGEVTGSGPTSIVWT